MNCYVCLDDVFFDFEVLFDVVFFCFCFNIRDFGFLVGYQ